MNHDFFCLRDHYEKVYSTLRVLRRFWNVCDVVLSFHHRTTKNGKKIRETPITHNQCANRNENPALAKQPP